MLLANDILQQKHQNGRRRKSKSRSSTGRKTSSNSSVDSGKTRSSNDNSVAKNERIKVKKASTTSEVVPSQVVPSKKDTEEIPKNGSGSLVLAEDCALSTQQIKEYNDELMAITKSQAELALALTRPKWQPLALEHAWEDPDDPKTMQSCIDRITALFWIRLIAIGMVESSTAFQAAIVKHNDPYNNVIDLSTTTICRNILHVPIEQDRNPQDVDIDDDLPVDDNNYNDESLNDDSEGRPKRRKSSSLKKKQRQQTTSKELNITCWWLPKAGSDSSNERPVTNLSSTAKPWEVLVQLRLFVQRIFVQHNANPNENLPFHNYTHSANVVIRSNKLLDMILCTSDNIPEKRQNGITEGGGAQSLSSEQSNANSYSENNNSFEGNVDQNNYGYDVECFYDDASDLIQRYPPTFGVRNDPILQLALLFSALVHDVAHHGVTNRQLCMEEHALALLYNDQSVQEKNSLRIAFEEFLKPNYTVLRTVLFGAPTSIVHSERAATSGDFGVTMNYKYRQFRQVVVNAVLSTDIANPEQTVVTKSKWKEAFTKHNLHGHHQSKTRQNSITGGQHREHNNSANPPSTSQYARKSSMVSDVTMSVAPNNPTKRFSAQNRRGSNVSTMTDCTEDSYNYNKRHTRRSSGSGAVGGTGRYQNHNASFSRGTGRTYSGGGLLTTIRSQRQLDEMDLTLTNTLDLDTNDFDDPDDYYYDQGNHAMNGGGGGGGGVANRRGSALSTFSTDSVAMMQKPPVPRRLSTTGSMGGQKPAANGQRQQRRESNESLTDVDNYGVAQRDSSFNDDYSYDGSDFANDSAGNLNNNNRGNKNNYNSSSNFNRRMSNSSVGSYCASEWGGDSVVLNQQHVRASQQPRRNSASNRNINRRMSNSSVGSYCASEWGGDSVVQHARASHPRRDSANLNRRMSNSSVGSYCASEWGGDSVMQNHHNARNSQPRRDSVGNNSRSSGVIQHHRYPHPESFDTSTDNNRMSHPRRSSTTGRRASLEASSTELTYESVVANSIDMNRKRIVEVEHVARASKGNLNTGKASTQVKKIMMETEDGDAIDISRYVWNDDIDNNSSFSLTPPSSVEDEYGGYAADYAAKFKNGDGTTDDDQIPPHDSVLADGCDAGGHKGTDQIGEYSGRVIVATTITNKPIDRRGSVSGAFGQSASSDNTPTKLSRSGLMSTEQRSLAMGNTTHVSSASISNTGPIRRTLNRRASTGTFPSSFVGNSLQGGTIHENSTIGFTGDSSNMYRIGSRQPLSSTRRRSMGTITSEESSNDASSTKARHPSQGNYKKRLGIRRSMDLSGEFIEANPSSHIINHYDEYSSDDAFSIESDIDELRMIHNMIEQDEPDDLKAAVVIETLLRVSDVGHSLQSWDNFVAWSSKLFHELCLANENKRGFDPRPAWYENQIRIMDSYLRPIALQLDEMGVFGEFNGVLFVQCVDSNRQRWISEGAAITEQLCKEAAQRKANQDIDLMRFL